MRAWPAALALLATLPTAALVAAQSPLAFDAASIRRSERLDEVMNVGIQPGGALRSTNLPPFVLIWLAHGVQAHQVVDAPDWLRTERYDITARPPDGVAASPESLFAMIRALLEDRFALRVRRETRPMPVYRLVRTGNSPGPGLRQVTTDCATQLKTGSTGPADDGRAASGKCTLSTAPGRLTIFGYPLRVLTASLGPFVDRTISDETGLSGNWEVRLEWTPDRLARDAPAPASDAPTLFTAIQEQLGLRLEAARGPAEVLVIESVARPTPN